MISAADFRKRLTTEGVDIILDEILLSGDAAHVNEANISFLIKRLAETYSLAETDIDLKIVGSAKLGFSISEKNKHGNRFPRYRLFSGSSDIDVSIVSPKLFELIWLELSYYAHSRVWIPWDSGYLGDYFVYGWLRPDHFPRGVGLRRCDDWWKLFYSFSANRKFGFRDVRGGLFYSTEQLRLYQKRALNDCYNFEINNI